MAFCCLLSRQVSLQWEFSLAKDTWWCYSISNSSHTCTCWISSGSPLPNSLACPGLAKWQHSFLLCHPLLPALYHQPFPSLLLNFVPWTCYYWKLSHQQYFRDLQDFPTLRKDPSFQGELSIGPEVVTKSIVSLVMLCGCTQFSKLPRLRAQTGILPVPH